MWSNSKIKIYITFRFRSGGLFLFSFSKNFFYFKTPPSFSTTIIYFFRKSWKAYFITGLYFFTFYLYDDFKELNVKGLVRMAAERFVVYSTKVLPETHGLLGAIAKTSGSGHRVLIEEMLDMYIAKYPEKVTRAKAYMELMAGGFQQAVTFEPTEAAADPVPLVPEKVKKPKKEKPAAPPRAIIQTIRYKGSEAVHLYEPGSKNDTGCGLAGELDQDTIVTQDPSAVTCGKCRYCRKPVFMGY